MLFLTSSCEGTPATQAHLFATFACIYLLSRKGSGDPETDDVFPFVGTAAASDRQAQVLGRVAPGSAASDTHGTVPMPPQALALPPEGVPS
jgi:hypothetical protein